LGAYFDEIFGGMAQATSRQVLGHHPVPVVFKRSIYLALFLYWKLIKLNWLSLFYTQVAAAFSVMLWDLWSLPVIILLGGIALALPPIIAHFSVAWSVCLSSVTLVVKAFDGFRRHLAGTLAGSNDTLCYVGVPGFQGRGDLGSNPKPKRAIVNCCQTVSPVLPPGECKRGVG